MTIINWPEKIADRYGNVRPNATHSSNYIHFLKLKYDIRYCTLSGRYLVNGNELTEVLLIRVTKEAEEVGLFYLKPKVQDMIYEIGEQNKMNLISNMISTARWMVGQESEIDKLFASLNLTIDVERAKMMFLKWFVGMVVRAESEGAKHFQLTMVLKGGQGVGKSRWLRTLVPDELYKESAVQPDNKDHKLDATTKVLWNIDEMEATMRKTDIEALKAFLTNTTVKERPAYGRVTENRRTVCTFAASVNSGAIFNDPTGTRRFFVIECTNPLTIEHGVDMASAYKEALHLFETGQIAPWLEQDEIKQLNETNEVYAVDGSVDMWLSKQVRIEGEGVDWIDSSQAYKKYVHWCETCAISPDSLHLFGRFMKSKGLQVRKGGPNRTTQYFIAISRAARPLTTGPTLAIVPPPAE